VRALSEAIYFFTSVHHYMYSDIASLEKVRDDANHFCYDKVSLNNN